MEADQQQIRNNSISSSPVVKRRRVKVVTLGAASSGKSCLIKRYCEKRFVQKYMATIGVDYGITNWEYEGTQLQVNFFDLGGDPLYSDVREEFYENVQGLIVVFDVCSPESFKALPKCLSEFQAGFKNGIRKPVVVVCANKTDKDSRSVSEGESRLWAETNGFYYFEASALSGVGVEEMFLFFFNKLGGVLVAGENPVMTSRPSYSVDDLDVIKRILSAGSDRERLGLGEHFSNEEVNKSYRRLAALVHPDKNRAPSSSDAFKMLLNAKNNLLDSK